MGYEVERQWLEERDKAVATLDLKTFKDFYNKWRKRGVYAYPLPADNKVVEISMYKMACDIPAIPEDVKQTAREWLRGRGYKEGF